VALDPADFDLVCALVRREAGIVVEPGKEFMCENRLARVATDLHVDGPAAVAALLRTRATPELVRAVVDAMTTNETSWFRDSVPFDALRQHLLPALAARGTHEPITIWSAASSTGQEGYSIAMTVLEHFPQLAPQIRIVGTDISHEAVAKAKAGRYSQFEINRGLPAIMMVKHFTQKGGEWEVKPELRRMVSFQQMNLLGTWLGAPTRADIVFLRNVLIYFDLPTKRQVLAGVRRVMRDGVLILGSAEMLTNVDDDYERVTYGRLAAYRARTYTAATMRIQVLHA